MSESVTLTSDAETPAIKPEESATPAVPEKFQNEDGSLNTEALLSSYQELESSQSQATPPAPEEAAPQSPAGDLAIPDAPPAEESYEGLPISKESYERYAAAFAESGELPPEAYDELRSKGFAKPVVDSFMAGQQALAVQAQAEILSGVGGAEGFAEIAQWASSALPPQEREAINRTLATGTTAERKLAVEGLAARRQMAEGPKRVGGVAGGAGPDAPFTSTDQMMSAISDPRYRKDREYTRSVEQRAAKSTF